MNGQTFSPYTAGQTFSPYNTGGGFSLASPPMSYGVAPSVGSTGGGGGGGWLSGLASAFGGPIGLGLGAANLVGGIISAIGAGGRKKKIRKQLAAQQKAYQSRAERLFPELSRESFQFKDPATLNAIKSAIGFQLQNLFGSWGQPPGVNQGYGTMQDFFKAFTPQQTKPAPVPKPRRKNEGGGGWRKDFEKSPFAM